ncbi:MAG: hypothetical protein WC682_02320 [Parcubacteria group bacterium]
MSLIDKIEEIRQKPEHEKIRYVWAMVAICMFFVIFIWIFSVKSMFRGREIINSGTDTTTILEQNQNEQIQINENQSIIQNNDNLENVGK